MRDMNIRQLLLVAFLFAAFLTLFLGGISAYTIRLLNENLSSSSTHLSTTVDTELASMQAHNSVSQMASGILAATTLADVRRQNPAGPLAELKAGTAANFDWSVGDSVTRLYEAKSNFLGTSEELNKQMEAYLKEVADLSADVSKTVETVTARTLEDAGSRQRTISGSTNDSTRTTLSELDRTARGTLDDVVLVLQLRGSLLELDVAVDTYAATPNNTNGGKIRQLLTGIDEMFGRIPEHVAGPFEMADLQDMRGKLETQLTGRGGMLSATTVTPAAKQAVDEALGALDASLLELADNTVFDGTTSLASYLEQVSSTLSGSLNTLIETQDSTGQSIQTALHLAESTAATKEALYELVFLVQEAVVTRSKENVARMQGEGSALLSRIEEHRGRLTGLLAQLGEADKAAAIGARLDALIAQARGNSGLLARTVAAVAAYDASTRANREIEENLAKASAEISNSFRTFTEQLTGSMESKVSEGGIWMRVQLGLVVFIVAVAVALGLWIGSMVARRLSSAVIQLFALSQRLSASSASLSESSEEQASVSSEQAASLEESSSTVEEISSMAQRNSESVRDAARISADVLTATMESTDKMNAMSKGMDELHRASDQISKIIRAIDEIAFQTNILALNAAVEAARAGEAGAGFAVVADEVRALALKCKNAAQETEQLIARNTSLTRDGVSMCGSVAQSLSSIRERINNLDTLIKSIADASQEQSVGLDQINRGLAETSATTQKNAALAEQGASSAQELNTESQNLIETIDNLTRLSGIKFNGNGQHLLEAAPEREALLSGTEDHEPQRRPLTLTGKDLHGKSHGNRLLDN